MKRRLFSITIIALLLIGLLPISVRPVQAGSLAAPYLQESENSILTFRQLGYTRDDALRGPYDTTYYSFALPADWQLSSGAEINFDLVTSFSMKGAATSSVPGMSWKDTFGGQLTVYMNNVLLGVVDLVGDGPQQVHLALPPESLVSNTATGQHELYVAFDAGDTCFYDWTSSLIIKTSSSLTLPHTIVPLVVDLTAYPRPIYQHGKIEPQTALIVVPDSPSEVELQAAFALSAGLGRFSENKLDLTLINSSALTETQRKDANIIFVGKPGAFPVLSKVDLPAFIKGGGFSNALIAAEDGIIEMVVSPWNPSRIILLVSGSSDTGIYKAGQAASYGKLRVEKQKSLSIITEINALSTSQDVLVDRTLADLGEQDLVFNGRGIIAKTVPFYFPVGKAAADDSFFEMIFSHSQVVDYERSGINVFLNDLPIMTVRLSDETSTQSRIQVTLPKYVIKPGMNYLRIQSELYPRFSCVQPGTGNIWATVSPESLLHIPIGQQASQMPTLTNLEHYPDMLAADPFLAQTIIVVPAKDVAAWDIANRLMYDLGYQTHNQRYEPKVILSEGNIENEINIARFSTSDIILVGQASIQNTVPSLNSTLPGMYDPASKQVIEKASSILYRFPPEASLGYLQYVASVWNKNGYVLAITGSTKEGVAWAQKALVTPSMLSKMAGNFAVVQDKQVYVGEIQVDANQPTIVAGQQVEQKPAATITVPQKTSARPAGWIPPILIGTVIMILGLIVFLAFRIFHKNPAV